jgi:hypothetical protein
MPANEGGAVADRLYDVIGVTQRPELGTGERNIRLACFIAAFVNFVSTVPFLVNSVLHHLFGVAAPLLTWAHEEPPSRPWLAWTFLTFGTFWGVFFLYIAAKPVTRRPWMKVAMAEKALTTVAVWADFLIFHNITWQLPVIVLVTDLAFVFVFAWTLRIARRLATEGRDASEEVTTLRIPVGSSPPARWLLRIVSIPTVAVAFVVVTASVIEVASPPPGCDVAEPAQGTTCEVLGTTNLWSLPPFLVWLWGGMAAIVAVAMLWAATDVVRRRDIIGFGVCAHLIPAAALSVARFTENPAQRPTDHFFWWVFWLELLAAGLIWIAQRTANSSALALGVDVPCPSIAAAGGR